MGMSFFNLTHFDSSIRRDKDRVTKMLNISIKHLKFDNTLSFICRADQRMYLIHWQNKFVSPARKCQGEKKQATS